MRSVLALVFVISSASLYAQIDEVRRITERLCSPEFHGRGYVNKGDSIAAAFLADEFEKIGVGPFSESYFQHFQLNVNTFPDTMMVSQKGRQLTAGIDYVINPSSRGAKYDELELVEIPSDKLFDMSFVGGLLQDVSNADGNTALLVDCSTLEGDTLKHGNALARELSTLVPVVQVIGTKFTWSVGREASQHLYLQIKDGVIDNSGTLSVNIRSLEIPSYQSQNVVAYIPGKKKCGKTIVFSAHYDHLGRMGTNTYFPGANDNASGTAMLLTMAKYFKENPSKYNILFIAFAGEEAGLVGSKYFVENPLIKLEKIRFVLNLDIMGSGEEGITAVNATLFEEEFALLQEINSEKNLLAKVKKRGPAANSDHYWFTENGVPAFFIYTMGPNKHYHDIYDEYSELSFNEYDDITALLIEFVKRLKK